MYDSPRNESTHSFARPHEYTYQRFQLRVTRGPDAGHSRPLELSECNIGSAQGNDFVLNDGSVSRHHCRITATNAGHLLQDLDSKNGTRLGEFRIHSAYLNDGASIELGSSTLTFELLPERVTEPISETERFDLLLGTSVAMRRIFSVLPKIAASDLTVLLEGETGTGKGLVAESIHRASGRAGKQLVTLDCASIPPTLIETELFGHTRGAFTGAHAARAGAFEAAQGGTLFLDEIGELPLEMQPKLLRALEERTIKRVGSTHPQRLDVRVIAASNRDLRQEVNRGTFRSDLFYRLNVVRLRVPPLRERKEDIPLLAAHFYRQVAGMDAREPPGELIQSLLRQDFRGNVRELRSAVERAVLMEDVDLWNTLHAAERPERGESGSTAEGGTEPELSFRAAKERCVTTWEHDYLSRLIRSTTGNVSAAARRARMDRNHLRELLAKHGISSKDE